MDDGGLRVRREALVADVKSGLPAVLGAEEERRGERVEAAAEVDDDVGGPRGRDAPDGLLRLAEEAEMAPPRMLRTTEPTKMPNSRRREPAEVVDEAGVLLDEAGVAVDEAGLLDAADVAD